MEVSKGGSRVLQVNDNDLPSPSFADTWQRSRRLMDLLHCFFLFTLIRIFIYFRVHSSETHLPSYSYLFVGYGPESLARKHER